MISMADKRAALEALADQEGNIKPEDVVDAVRYNPNHPLYDEFDWDQERAAYSTWVARARALIASVRVVVITSPPIKPSDLPPPRAFVRDPDKSRKETGYVAISSLRDDRERSIRVLAQRLADLEGRVVEMLSIARHLGIEAELRAMLGSVGVIRQTLGIRPKKVG